MPFERQGLVSGSVAVFLGECGFLTSVSSSLNVLICKAGIMVENVFQ